MNPLPPKLRLTRRSKTADGRLPRLAPARPADRSGRALSGWLRRLAQPLPLIGISLLVIAAVGYLAVAAGSRTRSSQVVVAARNLPAGTRLSPSDLRLVKLSAGQSLLAQFVPASAEPALLGRRLAAPLLAGLPVGRASLAAPGAGLAAFTLTVPALHALGGNLTVGDRVTVLATFTSQTGAASARVLARNLTVLSIGQPPAGLDANSTTVPVTVALSNPSIASALALANSAGKIDLLRDGSNVTAAIPAATISAGAAP
jgi:Flp pilus assembly protein CpaB